MSEWKISLQKAIKSSKDLLKYVDIIDSEDFYPELFPVMVPLEFADLIKKGDQQDPILKQVLAQSSELIQRKGYLQDPLEEAAFQPIPGLVHKYFNRVLLMVSSGCAVNCRYCFRRHFPYHQNRWGADKWDRVIRYLQKNQNIDEVILSGGDPLMMRDQDLSNIISKLNGISHLKNLRIHTRFPVVIPSRITDGLSNALLQWKGKVIMVFHINHPNEIGSLFVKFIKKIPNQVIKLNQSVLLKGVNNDAKVLKDLSYQLFENNIMPYYLHQLDPVEGAVAFEVEYNEAKKVYQELAAIVSGYLLPKWVQERPHEPNKSPLI